MKRLTFIPWRSAGLVLLLLVTGCLAGKSGAPAGHTPADQAPEASIPTTLFVNITSGKADPHAVVMALDLASQGLAVDKEVVLFFNVAGADIPTQSMPENVGIDGISVKERVRELMQQGVLVMVCSHCMHYLGVAQSDLLPGAVMATPDLLFSKLDAGTVVFTY